ncbi:pep-cterm sorting domain-containing protein [Anaeramoeba ignava]|uniref:Pep-cterm sorting domain-containing protein n=1 Tax=Anaeramoeba ignava TaxID=1746090 RepID=A0A9Q0R5T1_ANAIG|nr:pep-cterm sorting domain-containing protein [Anaeramoeba ignava]
MQNYSNLEKLSNDLQNLFQNQKDENYYDFEIICQFNQETNPISFKTHKSILSTRSQYFKSLFNSEMKDSQEKQMILKDISSQTLFSILNYFYSGKIELELQNAIEILFFSSKYLIDELIEISSDFIKSNFRIESIVDILKLSESMNFNQLMDSSYQFILENFDILIKTPFFLQLEENHLNSILVNDQIITNEFEIFQALIKWGKHKLNINQQKDNQRLDKQEKEQIQNQISNVIDKIRFIDFSPKELEGTLIENLIPNQISQTLLQFETLRNHQGNEMKLRELIQNQNSFIFKSRIGLQSSIIQTKEYFNRLKEWINDNEFFSKMNLGFSARRDGFYCKKWHDMCDNKGKTLVIIQTTANFIFGGFTKVGFKKGSDRYIKDSNAFIFSLRDYQNSRKPEKFSIKRNEEKHAIYYNLNYGPVFGGEGYGDIDLNSDLQPGRLSFGRSYNLPFGMKFGTNESKNYLAGSFDKWQVYELETFFI